MHILFWDKKSSQLHIATQDAPIRTMSLDEGRDYLLTVVDDSWLFVKSGYYLDSNQLLDLLYGNLASIPATTEQELIPVKPSPMNTEKPQVDMSSKKYLHCKCEGGIIISDIVLKNSIFVNNVINLHGKLDFLDLDLIGGVEAVQKSKHYQVLASKNKVEIVDHATRLSYMKNGNKKSKKKFSPNDEIEKTLVPTYVKAEDRAYGENTSDRDDTIDISADFAPSDEGELNHISNIGGDSFNATIE